MKAGDGKPSHTAAKGTFSMHRTWRALQSDTVVYGCGPGTQIHNGFGTGGCGWQGDLPGMSEANWPLLGSIPTAEWLEVPGRNISRVMHALSVQHKEGDRSHEEAGEGHPAYWEV